MKLKYYMRGLGIGMVVTAFILSVVLDKDTVSMSDADIMARARELGMVESTVLSQIASQERQEENKPSESKPGSEPEDGESESSAESTREPETVAETESETETEQETESRTESEESTESESEPESESEQEPEPESEPAETVTIRVTPGESSVTVSRSLEEAGLVESAKEYDRYLCNNGYDKIISVGTYEIPVDATDEEIAKIITKSR